MVTFYGGAAVLSCAEATAFLARTSGIDAAHRTAYGNLICGLVADGVWTKLDVLHVFATQDSTTAMLNLISASYTGVPTPAQLVFTADRGVNFVGGQIGQGNINPSFNPTTAPSPKFVRNSAHVSSWSLVDSTSAFQLMGAAVSGNGFSSIYSKYIDNNAYFYANTDVLAGAPAAAATATGHYIANRNSSTQLIGYKNGAAVVTDNANASVAPANANIFTASTNSSPVLVTVNQLAMSSIGGALTASDVTNFYNRLRTYMTAVGVP